MPSLRWKLVGLYALVLAGVIGAFSTALVVGWRRSQLMALDGELEARARAVCALAEREGDTWFVEAKSGLGEEFGERSGRYYVVTGPQGIRLMSSAIAEAGGVQAPSADGSREVIVGGARYRETAITLAKRADEEEGLPEEAVRVACGQDVAALESSVTSLTQLLAVIGPMVLLLSLGGGFLIVSHALRPIDEMARTAEKIQATDLSGRIDVKGNDELARLGKTLNEMLERLQAAFDRQTRFTADASHELRTPLSVVAGTVELGLKKPRTAEEYREMLEDIRESSDRMRSIVEGLLVLARADAKSLPFRREPVSLTAVANEIVGLCRPLADERTVSVTLDASDDIVVPGDIDRLRDLVSNLVTNAIRYNRPDGSVRVRLAQSNGVAELAVEDTGIGIPAEDLPHLFERFYRVDKARSRDLGGSGLGLAIAKWVVDSHGGKIEATSAPGQGSKFRVSLPAD